MPTATKQTKAPFLETKNGRILNFQRGHNSTILYLRIHCSKKIESLNVSYNEKPIYVNPGNKRTIVDIEMTEGETIKIYPLRGKKCRVVHYAGRNRVEMFKYTTWQRRKCNS